ncbi:MAG: hypothetical protein MK095_02930, partial [Phycisphaerales bacterium]|nr:hypothetical protein [Phycisphaerales bacterium]
MNQKPWLTLTSLLALTLGVVIATWLVPMWRTTDRIHDVASDDFDQRKAAWNWWRSEPAPLPMMELNRALSNASPEALLHGARELQDLNAWGWGKQTHTLMARYMTLLLWRSHIMDAHDVILLVDQAPSDAPADAMLEVGGVLFKHSDPAVANLGFNALVSWCGFRPVLSEMLTQLPPQRADWGLHFHHLLEHGQQPLRIRSMLNDPDALQQRLAEWNANLTDQDVLLLSSVRTATTSGDAHQRRSTAQRWLNDRDAQTRPMPADDPPPGSQRRLAGALLAAH